MARRAGGGLKIDENIDSATLDLKNGVSEFPFVILTLNETFDKVIIDPTERTMPIVKIKQSQSSIIITNNNNNSNNDNSNNNSSNSSNNSSNNSNNTQLPLTISCGGKSNFDFLPNDLLLSIIIKCGVCEIALLSKTCSFFRNYFENEYPWRIYAEAKFGSYIEVVQEEQQQQEQQIIINNKQSKDKDVLFKKYVECTYKQAVLLYNQLLPRSRRSKIKQTREINLLVYNSLLSMLPDDPRYFLYAFDDSVVTAHVFGFWCPFNTSVRMKLVYSASLEYIKRFTNAPDTTVQICEHEDVDYRILERKSHKSKSKKPTQ